MLYVTTRNNCDTFTAQKALHENREAGGGLYLPFQKVELPAGEKSVNAAIAETLNLLFQTRVTAWDVDFAIGRYPVRLEFLRQKTIMAESWHNPGWTARWMMEALVKLLGGEEIADWTKIAVRIAVLCGVFNELKHSGIEEPVDISVLSGDFSAPISAWYAHSWGLPIGNIICCCNENNSLWDLLSHGQLRTDALCITTDLPEADVVVPTDLERLIYEAGGAEEVDYFLACCRRGGMYCPEEAVLSRMREGMAASVISSQRLDRILRGAYATHSYLLSRTTALAYGGLLDYRAKTGTLRPALVLTEQSPARDSAFAAKALGMTEAELRKIL